MVELTYEQIVELLEKHEHVGVPVAGYVTAAYHELYMVSWKWIWKTPAKVSREPIPALQYKNGNILYICKDVPDEGYKILAMGR